MNQFYDIRENTVDDLLRWERIFFVQIAHQRLKFCAYGFRISLRKSTLSEVFVEINVPKTDVKGCLQILRFVDLCAMYFPFKVDRLTVALKSLTN